MPVGFYELLQVAPHSSAEALSAAYQDQIAHVVRKQRAAEARKQDVSTIEARRAALAEAYAVLSDPARRRRYDRFRELSRTATPTDPEELWSLAASSLVDPAAAAAVEVVRTLTDLKVGEALGAPPVEPDVRELRADHRVEARVPDAVARGEAPRMELEPPRPATRPEPAVATPKETTRNESGWGPARSEPTRSGLSDGGTGEGSRRVDAARTEAWPAEVRTESRDRKLTVHAGLNLHRAVPAESLARLFDEYGPTGAYLRASRELRKITLDELSNSTHISQRFLDAMERDAFTELPAATFVRGYLKMVVRALELLANTQDVDELVDGYMARYHRIRG